MRWTLLGRIVAVVLVTSATGSAAIKTWTGAGAPDGRWQTAANWGGIGPVAFDSLQFDGNVQLAATNNFSYFTFEGITFAPGAGAFSLRGNSLQLSGGTNGSNIGIVNDSAQPQMLALDLSIGAGLYQFTNAPGGSLILNSSPTAAPGAVAWFGPGISTTAWDTNSDGMISTLGCAAVFGNTGTAAGFSDLAAISGDAVSAYVYPASAQYSSDAVIGTTSSTSLTNVQLRPTYFTTCAYDLVGGNSSTFLNSILIQTNGTGLNSSELLIGTNALGGTLVLGSSVFNGLVVAPSPYIGGIFYPNPSSNNVEVTQVRVYSYKVTSGPMFGSPIPGYLILGVNGVSGTIPPTPQMEIRSMIVNNGSGGAVTVTKTGTGIVSLNPAAGPNTYSGGTYVNQGYLSAKSTNSLGKGAVVVTAGATLSLAQAGTWTNNISISPGTGTFRSGGALTTRDANGTHRLSGTLTVMGAATTNGVGSRITSTRGHTTILGGRIQGPGTLEFLNYDLGSDSSPAPVFTLNNTTANPNNWTGGLLINASSNFSVVVSTKAANQLATNNVRLIQAGTAVAMLDLGGFDQTVAELTSKANSNNRLTNSGAICTLTIGAKNTSSEFGGRIQGTLNLVKTGTGTQIFSGTNFQTGTLTVNAGKLVVNGRMSGTCSLVTQPNTVVTGFGNFGTAFIGGTIVPGQTNQVGTFRTGSTTLSNATLVVDLQNGTNDLLRTALNLSLVGTNCIQPVPATNNLSSGQQIKVITYTGTLTGGSSNLTVLPSLPGYSFSLVDPATTPGSIQISVDAVPPKLQPTITTFSLSETNLVMTGSNAVAGGTYYVLTSTNLAQPLSEWSIALSNLWYGDSAFAFTLTNAVNQTNPNSFYILQVR